MKNNSIKIRSDRKKDLVEKLLGLVAKGVPPKTAAKSLKIGDKAFRNWMAEDEHFADLVNAADAGTEADLSIACVEYAKYNPEFALKLLPLRFPATYGKGADTNYNVHVEQANFLVQARITRAKLDRKLSNPDVIDVDSEAV